MENNEITIRPAVASDLPALAPLAEQLGYPVAITELGERLAAVLGRSDHNLLVSERDRRVVAWLHGMIWSLMVEPPLVFIGGLVVDSGSRGQRIGEQLMTAMEDWAHNQGAREILVYSNVVRERAHKFYERIGYEHYKTSKVFRKKL